MWRCPSLSILQTRIIRDRPTAPRSPWENGHAERLIGSIRRECLDHVIVFGERHLRHVLRSYARYYNGVRTHLSLGKDSPLPRDVQAVGTILPLPVVQGLHHHYVRIELAIGTPSLALHHGNRWKRRRTAR